MPTIKILRLLFEISPPHIKSLITHLNNAHASIKIKFLTCYFLFFNQAITLSHNQPIARLINNKPTKTQPSAYPPCDYDQDQQKTHLVNNNLVYLFLLLIIL